MSCTPSGNPPNDPAEHAGKVTGRARLLPQSYRFWLLSVLFVVSRRWPSGSVTELTDE